MNRDDVLRILAEHKPQWVARYGLTKLGVFGSVARNEARPGSDVDVVIQTPVTDIFQLVALREEMVSLLGAEVDLVTDHAHLRAYFMDRLQREAAYV
jgi:predicted nucleotidyltransferase